ncbi:MAG: PD-(D/E)XK nuclease family protein, partial [Ketobacter sp.]
AELNALVMDETVFDSHLDDLINREMLEFRKRIHLTPEALYALEHARTFSALKSWILNSEVLRQPFTIDRIEKRQSINVAGLELSLTVDRIDELEDGSKIVIDYKTGSVTTSSWLGERPEEPQLPLYTLLDPAQTRGVYFAIVRPDKSEWQGLGEEGIGFSEKKLRTVKTPVEGWDSQVQQWKHTLELLAQEFLQGHATVTPLKETTCQYCHLSSVCRIKELNGADS